MFFDIFSMLCDHKGVSRYKACTDIGLNRSSVAKWKSGSVPTGKTLSKLASYFDVTPNYLLGFDIQATFDETAYRLAQAEKELSQLDPNDSKRIELEDSISLLRESYEDQKIAHHLNGLALSNEKSSTQESERSTIRRNDANRNVAFLSASFAEASNLTDAEYQHIKKYRQLDADGRRTIDQALDHELERLRQAQTGGKKLASACMFEYGIYSDGRLQASFDAMHPVIIHDEDGEYSDVRYVAKINFSDEHTGRFKAGDLIAFSNYADPYHSPEGTVVLVRYGNWAWLAKITGPNRYYPICSDDETAELENILYGDDEDYEDYIERKLVNGDAGLEPLGEFIGTVDPHVIVDQDET